MKKLLNISVIAALAVLPMAANAAVTDAEPAHDNGTAQVATADPAYALVAAESNDGNLATAGYVKGAYNATIKAINKLDATKQDALTSEQLTAISNVSTLSSRMTTAENDIDALETTVGDNTSGLVKDVADNASAISDLETTVGDNTSGLVKDVADNASAISNLESDVSDLQTASANYATKTGAAATAAYAVNNATVTYDLSGLGVSTGAVTGTANAAITVMDTWGSNTPASSTVAAPVDLTSTVAVTGLTGNTSGQTASISAGTVTYQTGE